MSMLIAHPRFFAVYTKNLYSTNSSDFSENDFLFKYIFLLILLIETYNTCDNSNEYFV